MNYNQFLFYSLIKDMDCNHPLKDMEYDLAYGDVQKYYLEFDSSEYNDENVTEYECIVKFLKSYK